MSSTINLTVLFLLLQGLQAKRELKEIFAAIINDNKHREFPSVLQAYGADSDEHARPDDDRLLDAIVELMWNASETVSSAAFSIVYHLTRNPSALQKARKELDCEDGETTGPSYVDCVVKEALRVTPPIGGAYRKVTKSIVMEASTFLYT